MQELNIHGVWAGKQAAKGTPAVTLDKRFIQHGGDIAMSRDDGEAQYSDLTKFGDAIDWVNLISGSGAPVVAGTPEELAWLFYMFAGGETTAAVVGPPAKTKHTTKPLSTASFWSSWHRRLGLTDITRREFDDCRITQLVVAGSTGQKDLRVTPSLLSLDPAVNKVADPAAALPTKDPFLFTDGAAAFAVNGGVWRGHSGFTLTLNEGLGPVSGDDATVYDLVPGDAGGQITATAYMDADGIAFWNTQVYGAANPAAGTKPLKTVQPLGSYGFTLSARNPATGVANGDKFQLTIPGVKWDIPDAPGPNVGGGAAELTLTGRLRRVDAATDLWTVAIDCDAAAFV